MTKAKKPARTSDFKRELRRRDRENYVLMAPFMAMFFIFTILPVGVSFVLGFTDFNMLQVPNIVFFDNYFRMFIEDPLFMIALKNTLIFALITGPVGYFMCFFFAWLINELSPKVRAVMTVVFYAPALSGTAYTIFAYLFSGDEYGLINSVLMQLGIFAEPLAWLQTADYIMPVLIIVQLWMSLGTGFLAFIAGLQGLDNSLFDAGMIDGIRNRLQELWYVTLPQMLPSLTFGAITQIVSSFEVGGISQALAGMPSTEYAGHTITLHIQDYGSTRFELGYACAIATVLFLMMMFAKKLVTKVLANIGH